ncbi:putative porin, partial [Gillisia sp. M10.2A]|nr:putative porin [Gillisia lutea]
MNDTTFLDTTLTIQKDYKFNYLRKDNFELLPFANVGQTYNSLSHNSKDENLLPQFGARARHYNFMEVEDIYYYEVPTPLTELFFKTVPEQGQNLDALFTVNTSERLNFMIAYKGLRSLGNYQNSLVSTGNFRFGINYRTPNGKYYVRSHFVSQDLLNRESGGLNDQALAQYLSKESEFDDRSLLEMQFENAENVLFGKRFYLNHQFYFLKAKNNQIELEHVLDFSDKKFIYRQDAASALFGDSYRASNLRDEVKLRHIDNLVKLRYQNNLLGQLAVKAGVSYYNYGYNSVVILEDQTIGNRLKGENYSFGAEYSNTFSGFEIYGDAMANLVGDFTGYYFTAGLGYNINENNALKVEINTNERKPNYNFLLNQSDYRNYNWQTDFDNQNSQNLSFKLQSKNIANITGEIARIGNYAYFAKGEDNGVKPSQSGSNVSYLKLKVKKQFDFGKFSLANTIMYQNVSEGKDVLNLPSFVTRNSFFYKDHWFQRALYLQTGFTLKYFTSYNMNGYDPVLAEFYVQNEQKLGDFPVVDFFFNAKVKQTRIFFKLEHLNELINTNNNFSAPSYPYRDFLVRFGLVWDFFL